MSKNPPENTARLPDTIAKTPQQLPMIMDTPSSIELGPLNHAEFGAGRIKKISENVRLSIVDENEGCNSQEGWKEECK